ncbi:MAG: glycosyltransferase family 4 protein [Gemmatimonadota bacterium]|nr:glycosyltransferase family 4 protein [Gemmatimonadota bacterium]
MRVLLLNYEYPPNGGGAGVATEMLARNLAARGAAVDVVTAGPANTVERVLAPTGVVADGTVANEGSLKVHRVRCRRTAVHQAGMLDAASYLAAALPAARRLLRTQHFDVAHFFFSLPTGALLPLLDLRGVPVVVSLRGSDVPGYDPHNRAVHCAHGLLRPVTRWIWRRADRVVAVCDSLGALGRETWPELRYAVVHNGVDLERFHPDDDRDYRTDRIRCLAVARLVERKGLRDLIRALALLERGRFRLDIVGAGPDEGTLRDLTSELSLGHEVRFVGALDRDATAARYRAADLFTLPSSAEAFGNVFAEALASGLPVVGSAVGGIPELVEHGVNGLLVAPNDPVALADAMRALADDPRRRREMSLRNRAKAEATLDWGQVTARYLSIYRGIQRTQPAPALVAGASSRGWS